MTAMTQNTRTNVELDRAALDRKFNARKFFLQWEWLLVAILVFMIFFNQNASGGTFFGAQMLGATTNFMDKAFLVLSMAFVIVIGQIDISVGSTTAMSAVLMALMYNAGMPMQAAMVMCLLIGLGAGLVNGILITRFRELPAMIITLSTLTIYRGIAYILLEDQASGGFPDWFQYLSWGMVGPVPFALIIFAIVAVVFGFVLHKTSFGRQLYAMGNSQTVSRFSGVKVDRNTIIAFTLNGLMAGVCALFLSSKMGSTRPNIALNYELEAIAMVVLGGFPAAGGKGRMIGAVLAIFIIGYLRYGLGLFNVASPVTTIIFGLLLIGSVLASNFVLNRPAKAKKASA